MPTPCTQGTCCRMLLYHKPKAMTAMEAARIEGVLQPEPGIELVLTKETCSYSAFCHKAWRLQQSSSPSS